MTLREQLSQSLESLSDAELQQVAEFLAFLKFRCRLGAVTSIDPAEIGAQYAESAQEDGELAEQGIAEYGQGLRSEDAR